MKSLRTNKNRIGTLLPLLYEILLLVENDDVDKCKGYNWQQVKRKVTKSCINGSEEGYYSIISDSGTHTLQLKKLKLVGYKFLKEVRNAFAHNEFVYDEKNLIIKIQLENLHGTITKDAFDEIFHLIKESKSHSKNHKNQSK